MLQWNEKDCNIKVNQISFLSKDPEKSKLEKHIKKKKACILTKIKNKRKIGYYYRNVCVVYHWILIQISLIGETQKYPRVILCLVASENNA